MKKGSLFLLVFALLAGLLACGSDIPADDPRIGTWKAIAVIDRSGERDVREVFPRGATLELYKSGRGILGLDGGSENISWSYGDYTLRVHDVAVGTIRKGVLRLQLLDSGTQILFEKVGGYFAPNEPDPTEPPETDVLWWDGHWYGYWSVVGASGEFAQFADKTWDCFAVIDLRVDDTPAWTGVRKGDEATVTLWDTGAPLGVVELSIDRTGGKGKAASKSGSIFYQAIKAGDWTLNPDANDAAKQRLVIEHRVTIPHSGDYMEYRIVLRRWGELWNDVSANQWPPSYAWYTGQISRPMLFALADFTIDEEPVYIPKEFRL
ncbi:MAG: hypothetical protein FWE69_00785 [Clostridiales bacterium]|nr:hypothetical protein [Clostridiales bacterium]